MGPRGHGGPLGTQVGVGVGWVTQKVRGRHWLGYQDVPKAARGTTLHIERSGGSSARRVGMGKAAGAAAASTWARRRSVRRAQEGREGQVGKGGGTWVRPGQGLDQGLVL